MGKSAAEKMREYRKRLKNDPEKYQEYLNKAKQRKLQNYTPVDRLSRKEKDKRREQTRDYVKRHRNKKKAQADANIQGPPAASDTSGYETNAVEDTGPMVVNLPFPNRKNGPRKRVSRALSKKHRECKDLKEKLSKLRKKYKRRMRSLQRLKKKEKQRQEQMGNVSAGSSVKISRNDSSSIDSGPESPIPDVRNQTERENPGPSTPRSKTEQVLNEAGLNKAQRAKVRKQLLLSFVLQVAIQKCRRGMKQCELGSLRGYVGGDIVSKYRLADMVTKSTGIGRNRIADTSACVKKLQRKREVESCRDRVVTFLMRDDNSRCNPGKQDKMKVNGETHQTRILTDYLQNLYLKFKGENPNVKLSLASFCRIRPAYIKLTRFISRNSCLCTKHQNFALCTQALRKLGVDVPLNSEKFIQDDVNFEKVKSDTPDEITFGQWKRVVVEEKGKKKMVMRIVSCTMKRDEFLKFMEEQIKDFTQHVYRVRRQYEECLNIKQNLPKDEVIIQMDFAENYSCKGVDEIQSAYWNQTGVTLHPVVIYHKDDDSDDMKHESRVIVSDEMSHNSSVVLTFVDCIIPEIKKNIPNLRKVHYYTDSPTSQYRNKAIFHAIANHKERYECEAVWNYFEAGHGKGPCDGLGGTVKRMADEAVRSGKNTIQDAEEFFKWTQTESCSMKSVKFMFVKSSMCEQKAIALGMNEIKPVKGTMKVHAVIGKGNNEIMVSNVSCYCEVCISGKECEANQWSLERLYVTDKGYVETCDPGPANEPQPALEATAMSETIDVSVGRYVAARYDSKVYVGKIVDYDEEDNEIEISFMQNIRKLLQWPTHEDKLWLEKGQIICNISEPIPTGKSARMFKLTETDLRIIESST